MAEQSAQYGNLVSFAMIHVRMTPAAAARSSTVPASNGACEEAGDRVDGASVQTELSMLRVT